jgi:maltose O-acetyltransferase
MIPPEGSHEQAALVRKALEWLPSALDSVGEQLPPRWCRWFAMYYPDASVRRFFWARSGVRMGEGTYANYGMKVVSDPTTSEIAVHIGSSVSIAPGVVFVADSAPNNSSFMQSVPYIKEHLTQKAPIVVGDHVWIGANAVIFPGVTIGECSIVGAGSIVRHDVPPWTIVAGVPAKKIRNIEHAVAPPDRGKEAPAPR